MKTIIALLTIVLLTSCAMAPLSNTTTARTNGKGEVNLELGAVAHAELPYFRLGYGFFNRVDVGLLLEINALINTIGLWTKIGLIQSKMGLSWSLIGSYGSSGNDADYYYAGSIVSLKLKMVELYGLARYNHLEANTVTDINFGDLFTIPIGTPEYDFILYSAGINLWFADWFGINAHASAISGDLDIKDSVILLGGGLLFRI